MELAVTSEILKKRFFYFGSSAAHIGTDGLGDCLILNEFLEWEKLPEEKRKYWLEYEDYVDVWELDLETNKVQHRLLIDLIYTRGEMKENDWLLACGSFSVVRPALRKLKGES